MRTIKVIESADELIVGLKKTAIAAGTSTPLNHIPTRILKVGPIRDTYLQLDLEDYQLSPGITMKSLLYALCNREGIQLVEDNLKV